ncbi:hypothetical protein J4573_41640 [Actinomadura barringtoniae]|uniref:Uncharacterized protein n=1 Tax=Actinomadura barringtoniae TaxID=1427535 RepID=A0A939T5E5_9ACTN|nr:hypothetical protein [Actinomadura barringtoniae]MBO2453651.1 hypothetical protein [Actinomadura barringtoniae]
MTPYVAATATHTAGTPALIFIGLLLLAGYVIGCWIWPFRACTRCDGAGKFRSPSGRSWRYCHRCGGKGAQLRLGRRLWNGLKR